MRAAYSPSVLTAELAAFWSNQLNSGGAKYEPSDSAGRSDGVPVTRPAATLSSRGVARRGVVAQVIARRKQGVRKADWLGCGAELG